ncbi:hypothetical protein D3C80_1475310 [compost metagenome]
MDEKRDAKRVIEISLCVLKIFSAVAFFDDVSPSREAVSVMMRQPWPIRRRCKEAMRSRSASDQRECERVSSASLHLFRVRAESFTGRGTTR